MAERKGIPSNAVIDEATRTYILDGQRYDYVTHRRVMEDPPIGTEPRNIDRENTDPDLIKKYDQVYSSGEEKFWTFAPLQERMCILDKIDFDDKEVLEIGCGTGYMAGAMIEAGAHLVDAYDLSAEAITEAGRVFRNGGHPMVSGLNFQVGDPCGYNFPKRQIVIYDVVVMIGVLEHVEKPFQYLNTVIHRFMAPGSMLACSCPLFLNPRGYIWVALKYLFDAPMSLTDKHELGPAWFKKFAAYNDDVVQLVNVETVDGSWGCGERMIKDFRQRLPKVFPEMDPAKIKRLIDWLYAEKENHVGHGANGVYFLRKK